MKISIDKRFFKPYNIDNYFKSVEGKKDIREVFRELSGGARQRLKGVYTGPRAAVPNKVISVSAAGIPRERERDSRKS